MMGRKPDRPLARALEGNDHALFSHPQEQFLQSQVLQQVDLVGFFRFALLTLDIVFLPFVDLRVYALSKGLTYVHEKHYSP